MKMAGISLLRIALAPALPQSPHPFREPPLTVSNILSRCRIAITGIQFGMIKKLRHAQPRGTMNACGSYSCSRRRSWRQCATGQRRAVIRRPPRSSAVNMSGTERGAWPAATPSACAACAPSAVRPRRHSFRPSGTLHCPILLEARRMHRPLLARPEPACRRLASPRVAPLRPTPLRPARPRHAQLRCAHRRPPSHRPAQLHPAQPRPAPHRLRSHRLEQLRTAPHRPTLRQPAAP